MNEKVNKKNKIKKLFLITAGTLLFAIGIIGVILPVLPTTPFLMGAAACYVKSSDKLYKRLEQSSIYKRTAGRMIEEKGMTLGAKLGILIPVWGILLFLFFTIENTLIRIILITLGTVKTIVFAVIKTLNTKKHT